MPSNLTDAFKNRADMHRDIEQRERQESEQKLPPSKRPIWLLCAVGIVGVLVGAVLIPIIKALWFAIWWTLNTP
jgi:hypothetical protein